MHGRGPGGLTLVAFALAVTLGGGNFLAVRFSNRELEPLWGAGVRFAGAALLFIGIVVIRRLPWPRGALLRRTMLFGTLGFAAFYALMYSALVTLSAGAATIVLAVVPLITVVLAALHGLERLRLRSGFGAVLALAGIVWMIFGPQPVDLPLAPLLALLAAALCVSESIILGKRVADNHPAVTNAVGMTTGAVLLLMASSIAGESRVLPRAPEVVWAVVYLVTLGSGGLFVLMLLVIRRWTASATSYLFVLFPVATLALGAWLADEPVTTQSVIGAALVIAGVWLGALSPGARRVPSPTPLAPPPGAAP